MFGLETLDVLIGLITVYLTFGIACTAIVETVAACLSLRSSTLEAGLKEFLAGDLTVNKKFVDAFYEHPLVQTLSKGDNGRPSYIPPEVVGQVVEALITANAAGASLANAVEALPETSTGNRIKALLKMFATRVGEDSVAFRKVVETHFDAVMDRASGWFKRRQQTIALIASAVLVLGANVDTVALAISLASSPAARERVVEIAEERLREAQTIENTLAEQVRASKAEGTSTEVQVTQQSENALKHAKQQAGEAFTALDQAKSELQSAGLAIGWKAWPAGNQWLAKIAGLLVSIFAVSLGAPFWFDLLQGFMQVRAAGVSPRENTQENSTSTGG